MQLSRNLIFEHFHHSLEWDFVTICSHLSSYLQTHSTDILLLTCMDLLFLDISCKWDHAVCGLLHLWVGVMFLRLIVVACIILPKNILLFGYTTFNLSIHQQMDIWFVSAFSLFCLICACSFHFTQVVTSVYLLGSNDESVFQSGSFKFCSSTYQQCMRVPISPFPCRNLLRLDTNFYTGYMIFKYFFLVHACLFTFFNGVFWNA